MFSNNAPNNDNGRRTTRTKRALRAIYTSHSETYEELLQRANVPTLYNRRLQDIVRLMYKVKCGLLPDNVSNLFVRKDSAQSLRNE